MTVCEPLAAQSGAKKILGLGFPSHSLGWSFSALVRVAALGLMASFPAHAQPSAPPDAWQVADLAVLVDPDGSETIDSVSQAARAADFKPAPNGFAQGYTRKVHWLRFTLPAPPARPGPPERAASAQRQPGAPAAAVREGLLEIQPPMLDDLRLYLPHPERSGQFEVQQTGDLLPYAGRDFAHRAFVQRIFFASAAPQTVYLRVQNKGAALVLLRWWAPQRFAEQSGRVSGVLGCVFGLLLASLLINVRFGRDASDALYRRFMWLQGSTLFLLLGINGLVAAYLFPQTPWLCDLWVCLSFPLQIFCGTRFYLLALAFDKGPRWSHRLMQAVMAAALVGLVPSALGYFSEVMQLLAPAGLLALALGMARSGQLLRQRATGSRPLFMSSLLRAAGALSSLLALQGWLPVNLVLLYGVQFGVVSSLMVLRRLLGQRVNELDAQRNTATAAAALSAAVAEKEHESLEQQRHFLAMLVHELKTPLSVIRMRLGSQAPSERMQSHARQAVSEIDSLIDRCALVTQMEDRPLLLTLATCNLADMLGQLRLQSRQAERVVLASSLSAADQSVHTDPLWLRMALSNLLDNALKYSPAQSLVDVTLVVQSQNAQPGVQVCVRNAAGPAGMPNGARLFEKYYRAAGAQAQSGSGLGLYIVKRLAGVLGGTVSYHPQPATVTFVLWLPLTQRP